MREATAKSEVCMLPDGRYTEFCAGLIDKFTVTEGRAEVPGKSGKTRVQRNVEGDGFRIIFVAMMADGCVHMLTLFRLL